MLQPFYFISKNQFIFFKRALTAHGFLDNAKLSLAPNGFFCIGT
uniref:Uncharacterized protein n=1 Tax=Anguilla anguilla TaxID=7936 RepID=A0A0E9SGZ0_ANGAN